MFAPWWCCCDGGGGGGGGDCCVCGSCEPKKDILQIPGTASVTISSNAQWVGCCSGPRDECLSYSGGADASAIIDIIHKTSPKTCNIGGNGRVNLGDRPYYFCPPDDNDSTLLSDFVFMGYTTVFRTLVENDESVCPQVTLPNTGAIIDEDGFITTWGGLNKITGPIMKVGSTYYTVKDIPPLPTVADALFIFTGKEGSCYISRTHTGCMQGLCIDGCAVYRHLKKPFRISGGGSVSGSFDCSGVYSATASYGASWTVPCEVDLNTHCGDDGLGVRCVTSETALFSTDVTIEFDFSPVIQQCPPNPNRGTGSNTGTIGTETIHIPQAFLNNDPILQQAHDAIRSLFGPQTPGIGQVPPPARPAGDFLP